MKKIIKCIPLVGILAAPFVIATPALAQFQNVGSIDFPTSASGEAQQHFLRGVCLLYTSPSPRDATLSRMPSSA